MTKSIEQLEQQLADIQAELAVMKEKQKEMSVATPWAITSVGTNGYAVHAHFIGDCIDTSRVSEEDLNAFAKEEVAQGFANAFRVMILLRQCEGAGQWEENGRGWTVSAAWGEVDNFSCTEFFTICPPFPSRELAKAAADKVGIENIKAAYKFLAYGA